MAVVVAALLVLAFPTAGESLTHLAVGALLIISGASRLIFSVRDRRFTASGEDVLRAGASALAGLALLIAPAKTIHVVVVVLAIYALVQSLTLLLPPLVGRRTGFSAVTLVRGLMLFAVGAALLLVPETVVASIIVVAAVLALLVGALMLSLGLQDGRAGKRVDASAITIWTVVYEWLNERNIGPDGRYELGQKLYFEQPDRTDKIVSWSVMLVLSVAIATFGVLQDSTAVVIGAMLIAPLMVPILGIAAALVNGRDWWSRLGRSFAVVAIGVVASVGIAWIIGSWLPAVVPFASNSQITSRVNPNIIDMLIALAAGAAGAYANVSKRASDSVAGVAIAVALVPPLSVVGLNLEAGFYSDAGGAMLLFLTNLVAIVLSATVVFLLMGAAPIQRFLAHRKDIQSVLGLIATAALFISIPLSLTIVSSLVDTGRQKIAQSTVTSWLSCTDDFESAEYCTSGAYTPENEDPTALQLEQVSVSDDVVSIAVTGSSEPPPLAPLEAQLSEVFRTPVTVIVEFTPSFTYEYSKAGGGTTRVPSDVPSDSVTAPESTDEGPPAAAGR
jgi:uncharacterized hydrophobic protein (TIGR00271 family)